MVKKAEYVCKLCKEKTDNADKFIHESGICRKCYMKEYYKKHPKKSGSKPAPKKLRQGEDVVGKMLAGTEVVSPGRTVTVNFKNHPELFDFLKKMAVLDFRTPDAELLAILDRYKEDMEATNAE